MVAFAELDAIEPGAVLDSLPKKQVREVQRVLSFVGYLVGVPDGLIGPKTRNALAEFKSDIGEG
jgi:peptidoglycan hydrolase-like protein with peptidoglycan-binding domain